MSGTTVLARNTAVRMLFVTCFVITAAITYTMLQLRANAFDPDALRIFHRLFLFQDYPATFLMLCILLLALMPSLQTVGLNVARILGDRPLYVALVSTVILACAARFGYLAHPLSMDEYAAVFQSRIFADGHLSGRFPVGQLDWLVPHYFQNVFLVVSHQTGQISSAYWPGFALFLTPFSLIGVPWLCNPVIAGATLLALHRLAMNLFADRVAAGFVLLLTLASTVFTINAISFYSMPAHLLLNVLYAICLLRKHAGYAFLAGLLGSWALVLHNPFPHALFALPWIVWILFQRHGIALLGAMLVGYVPFALLLGLGWTHHLQELKGLTAVTVAAVGAEKSIPFAIGGLWQSALRIFDWPNTGVAVARAIGIAKLWLWATPGLLVLAAYGLWRRRTEAAFMLLGASALATFLGYLFYPADQGHGWGFRYFHSAWLALPVLAVAGLWGRRQAAEGHEQLELRGYVAAGALLCVVTMTGLRLYQVHDFIANHLAQLPRPGSGIPAVQILRIGMGYYAQDLVQNDPFLRTRPIIMITHGRADDAAMMSREYPQLMLLESSYRGSVWGAAARKTE